jgi:YD repeat-containing protein
MNLELFKTMTPKQRQAYGESLPDGTVKNQAGLPLTRKFTSCDDSTVHGWREYRYNDMGKLLLYMDSNGTWMEQTYDARGRPLTEESSDGRWTKYIRTARGRLLKRHHANGAWIEYIQNDKGSGSRTSEGHCRITGRGRVSREEFNDFINLTNPVKEYTHGQIEKLLGYKIKITNEQRIPFFDANGNKLV